MPDTERNEGQALTRVTELKTKIQQAAELIGELRESNYSLSGEIAELRREVESLAEGSAQRLSSEPTEPSEPSEHDGGAEFQAELDALREERKTIREKVALLLTRLEKLES